MKWIFLLFLFAAVPALTNWLNANHHRAHYVWALLGALPFFIGAWHLSASPVAWPMWGGYGKGIEITALDALALAVLMSKPLGRYTLPFKGVFLLYFLAVVLSVFQSAVPMASTFYPWLLLRDFLVFAAVARVAATERGALAILTGLVLAMGVVAGYSIADRLGGAIQTGSILGHQNTLGLIAHLIMLPSFALILSGRHVKLGAAGIAFCLIAVILTASRAGIGFGAAGFILVYLLSVFRQPSGRKASMGLALGVMLLVAYPFAKQSLQRRYDSQIIAMAGSNGYDERAAFEKAAHLMIKDHPFGVGPNMYVTTANIGGYSEKAGVIWNAGSRSASVHNLYLLIRAETGYFGIISFFFIFISASAFTLKLVHSNRDSIKCELVIGVYCGIIVVAMHSFYEWIFLLREPQYLFYISLGLLAGLGQQISSVQVSSVLRDSRQPPRVKIPVPLSRKIRVKKFH